MTVELRRLSSRDAPALGEFFASTTPRDRTFFWEDVADQEVAARWAAGDDQRVSWAAVDGAGVIIAFGALLGGSAYTSHVAEMVLVVGSQTRRRGIGTALARRLLIDAVNHGYLKVTIQIAADSTGAIEMFHHLGFEAEALLRDHLRSPADGQLRDLIVLAHLVDEQWSSMVTAGIGDDIR